MKSLSLCFVICVIVQSCYCYPTNDSPKFGANYYVRGVLKLPYAEIVEPFEAYYDKNSQRSRIDYYNGVVKTFQRGDQGDYGVSYKLAFMPDENGQPIQTCFQVNGTKDTPVSFQSILPDLTSFNYVKDVPCDNSQTCELWHMANVQDNRENKYTMLLEKTTLKPVYYEMKGYNNLLGSHYDKYELSYTGYVEDVVTDENFEIETTKECSSFPGPGVEEMVINNPMREFINNDDSHVHESYEQFKQSNGKTYNDPKEHESRKNIYRQNYRYVQSMNRAGLSFALKINHMADYTDMEMRRIRGRLPSTGYNGGQEFPAHEFPQTVPDNLDWRLYGAVTPVKDQAVCGSCWSFGTTGTIEGAYFLKHNKLVKLSEQELIDCSWQYQNNGCDGGEDFRAYAYIQASGGLSADEDYGSYLGADGICHQQNEPKTAQITGFVNVTSGDLNALKLAIAKKGPISVSIDAAHKSFSFYSHGVYYNPECKNGPDQLDHSVLAVGYGVMNNEPYWLVKNSWSTYWGNDGYVLMSQKDNNCGVATSATYITM